jgi:hypothetical protein
LAFRSRSPTAGVLLSTALLAACGGGGNDDALPVAGTPAPRQAAVQADTAGQAADVDLAVNETELVREVFSYRGSGRDPFISLLKSGDVRPLPGDLRVTSITYDPRYPSRSVAVLRDTTVNRGYTVRVGDELGRIRVAEIRPREVVVIVNEFGAERQLVLRQRSREQEVQP